MAPSRLSSIAGNTFAEACLPASLCKKREKKNKLWHGTGGDGVCPLCRRNHEKVCVFSAVGRLWRKAQTTFRSCSEQQSPDHLLSAPLPVRPHSANSSTGLALATTSARGRQNKKKRRARSATRRFLAEGERTGGIEKCVSCVRCSFFEGF